MGGHVMGDLDRLLLRPLVERLLAPWRRTDGPGVTLGVVLGRELVVHESAGMASLEFAVPIGPATTFRIASVAAWRSCCLRRTVNCQSRTMSATTSRCRRTLAIASRSRT